MTKAIVPFETAGQVPAAVTAFLDQNPSNIAERTTVPSLGYEGKAWSISIDGAKTKLMRKDQDGEDVPVPVFSVVLLNYAKWRGRAYYASAYNPNVISQPDCWSNNGKTPDASIETPQHSTCETCPMAAKGSKVTDANQEGVACSQHRMLAVVPANNLDFTPLRLKIAITSDYDKAVGAQNNTTGWYSFSGYTDFLRSRGISHTGAVVTKMKFDPGVAYPKLLFAPKAWLTDPADLAKIAKLAEDPEVLKLLNNTYTLAGVNGVPVGKKPGKALPKDDDDDNPALPGIPTQTQAATPAEEDAEAKAANVRIAAAKKAAEKAAAELEAAQKAAAAKKAAPPPDDDEEPTLPAKTPAATPAKTGKKTPSVAPASTPAKAVPANIAGIMGEWENE